MKKVSKVEVDKTSASISKAGPSKQLDPTTQASEDSDAQPMDTDFCGPSLLPRFTQSVQSDHGSKHSDPQSEHSEQPKRVSSSRDKKHKVWAKYYSPSSSSEEDLSLSKSLLSLNRLLLSTIG